MVTQIKKNTKQVKVISRTQFRSDLRKVVYSVRASNGVDKYETTLFNGKAVSCTCPAHGNCYHRDQLEVIEAGRKAVEQVQAARVASAQEWTPVSEPKTEKDANLQAEWGSPVYDEAHYTAKFARMDEMNAIYNRHLTPIQCKSGLYVPEDAPTFEKMDRAAYDAVFDPSGLAFL